MNNLIRTLTADDAEHFARNVHSRRVRGGRVRVDNIKWFSQALRTWELEQRSLYKSPNVDVYINELDLEFAYVTPRGQPSPRFKAESTLPEYSKGLSLYEDERLREVIHRSRLEHKLDLESDQEMCQALREFRMALARCTDKRSLKTLVISAERLKLANERKGEDVVAIVDQSSSAQAVEKRKRGRPRKQIHTTVVTPSLPGPSTTQVSPDTRSACPSLAPVSIEQSGRSKQERFSSVGLGGFQ